MKPPSLHPHELISALIDDEATEAERAFLAAHLESCADCRRLEAELRLLDAARSDEPIPPVPPRLEWRINARLRRAGRAAAPAAWRRWTTPWSLTAVAGLAAVGVLAVVLLRQQRAGGPGFEGTGRSRSETEIGLNAPAPRPAPAKGAVEEGAARPEERGPQGGAAGTLRGEEVRSAAGVEGSTEGLIDARSTAKGGAGARPDTLAEGGSGAGLADGGFAPMPPASERRRDAGAGKGAPAQPRAGVAREKRAPAAESGEARTNGKKREEMVQGGVVGGVVGGVMGGVLGGAAVEPGGTASLPAQERKDGEETLRLVSLPSAGPVRQYTVTLPPIPAGPPLDTSAQDGEAWAPPPPPPLAPRAASGPAAPRQGEAVAPAAPAAAPRQGETVSKTAPAPAPWPGETRAAATTTAPGQPAGSPAQGESTPEAAAAAPKPGAGVTDGVSGAAPPLFRSGGDLTTAAGATWPAPAQLRRRAGELASCARPWLVGTDPLLVFVRRGSSPEDVLARLMAPHGGRAMRALGADVYLLELPRAGVEAFFRELSRPGRPFARETAPPEDYDCALLFVGVRRE